MNMSFEQIREAFENAGYEPRSYSGRGMYGKECLGVVCSDPITAILETLQAVEDEATLRDLISDLFDPSEDSMGRDSIVYWTRIVWEDEEKDEDEEAE